MQQLADNLWLRRYPLRLMGCAIGRNVTIVRLASGELVIHSSAPFSEDDVAAIRQLGEPAWLVDVTHFHDTFAERGRRAFPELPYLAPPGFRVSFDTQPIVPPPEAWNGELEVLPLDGMPRVREHIFYHRPSKTLIAADLLFNLEGAGWWTRSFLRLTAGLEARPSMSRFFRFFIRDREAFRASLKKVRELDIQRIIVAHGNPIEKEARQTLEAILSRHGF